MRRQTRPARKRPAAPAATASPDRMRLLHRATLSLYTDLSLDGTLRRIVRAARELTQARYAALGVPDGRGGMALFLTEGLDAEEVARIPHPPVGRGLIGEVYRSGRSIRLADLSSHPRSAGFPEGHPAMRSFLGVPISAFGRPIGQIYLTERTGEAEFTEEDQNLIEMLAAHAAAAMENARLYRQVQDRETELATRNRELELVNSLSTAVSTAIELEPLLQAILDRVVGLFQAQAGEVFLRAEEQNVFVPTLHRGMADETFWQTRRFGVGEGIIGQVAASGKATSSTDLAAPEATAYLRPALVQAGFRTLVSVPLKARAQVVGVMSLAFMAERALRVDELGLLEAIGAGVGVAVENARLYRQARRVAVLEERERIAMDLHDGIIQSIYAVGLTLDSAKLQMQGSPQSETAVGQVIERLNGVIRDIRAYILDLQPSRVPMDDLGAALGRLADEFRANTLIETDVQTDGALGRALESDARAAMFHISQEALANVAKHARASRVWLSLRREDGEVVLQVIDNGQGFDAQAAPTLLGHGLSNIVERGHAIGATVNIASDIGEGTTVTVRLPHPPIDAGDDR